MEKTCYSGIWRRIKRHGKGKEYNDCGYLIFEGEYFYGKHWNGKGYDGTEKNNLAYELKDGKEYIKVYYKGRLKFEGEFKNGLRNRKGKEYYNDWLKFEGEYKNDLRNGKGKEYNDKGNLIFEGEYLINRKWDGKGYDINGNGIYELHNGNGILKNMMNIILPKN